MNVLTDVSQVTLDHLRRVLAQFGDMSSFSAEPLRADNATVARIHIRYVAQSNDAPASLFLKCVPGGGPFGASEMHYYRRDYADGALVGHAAAPRIRDADPSAVSRLAIGSGHHLRVGSTLARLSPVRRAKFVCGGKLVP